MTQSSTVLNSGFQGRVLLLCATDSPSVDWVTATDRELVTCSGDRFSYSSDCVTRTICLISCTCSSSSCSCSSCFLFLFLFFLFFVLVLVLLLIHAATVWYRALVVVILLLLLLLPNNNTGPGSRSGALVAQWIICGHAQQLWAFPLKCPLKWFRTIYTV